MSLPRSAKVLRMLNAAGVATDTPLLLPPGTLIVAFVVPARPVPWSVPHTTRTGHAYKDKRLVAWQAEVALCARIAMRGRAPYAGPVRLEVAFYLERRGGSPPDTSNLTKAFEDSLQGVVIENDKAVVWVQARRFLCGPDRAHVEVYTTEEQ